MNQITNIYPSAVIFGVLVCFYLYHYLANSASIKRLIFSKSKSSKKEINYFLTKKILGLLCLGLIPAIIYAQFTNDIRFEFGCTFRHLTSNAGIIVLISSIILLLVYINQKRNIYNSSLQMNYTKWNLELFLINGLGWIIYLLAYEFLFRGILLFECNKAFGFWPAIAINITLYSAIHMISGKRDALGALPFGFVACYLTLQQGTILIPVFMHITLSLGSDFFSIKLNPDIEFSSQSELKNLQK